MDTAGSGARGWNLRAIESMCAPKSSSRWEQSLKGGTCEGLTAAMFVRAKRREQGMWSLLSHTRLPRVVFGEFSVQILASF